MKHMNQFDDTNNVLLYYCTNSMLLGNYLREENQMNHMNHMNQMNSMENILGTRMQVCVSASVSSYPLAISVFIYTHIHIHHLGGTDIQLYSYTAIQLYVQAM
jgi:hypothetical protein